MRRFLIWTLLAAVVGVALAAGGFWAYWSMYARFQPVTITRNQAEIQLLLDASPYLSAERGGVPIWIVGYRDSAVTQAFAGAEADRLRAGGIEPRIVLFARPDRDGVAQSTAAERATIAELWLSRDWALYERWMATSPANWTAAGLPAADDNAVRMGVVESSREMSSELSALLRDAGVPTRWPLVLWRDPRGFLKACACSDRRAWPFIEDDLGVAVRRAPAAAQPLETPTRVEGLEGPPVAADTGPGTRPYPKLEDILPAPEPRYERPSAPAITPRAPVEPAPTARAPATPAAAPVARPTPAEKAPAAPGRRPPEAQRQDETTFF
ncbi:hypothetical protein [Brevundimonas variabilis]|uniref:Uncharacterized protein n=1 Tax=Brevundimonas variabilis TaxID=74312 RepID=A0A7W9CH83_9CAUL|nr:hypothetical protein [Brevundimonas variabilis]MBB5745157.1 hypothetical protein [Brevundimonas variabilis]